MSRVLAAVLLLESAVFGGGAAEEAHARVMRGLAQYLAYQPDAATETLRGAALLDPGTRNLWMGLRQLTSGHAAEALPLLQQAVDAEPANMAARQVLADALYESGHYYLAAAQLLAVTEAQAGNARAFYVLGRTWAQLARDSYQKLLDQAPADSAWNLAATADGLFQRRLDRRALLLYREALRKNPNLVTARESAAEIYRLNGRPDWEARERAATAELDCGRHRLACDALAGRYKELLTATLKDETPNALYWRAQAYTGLAHEAFGQLERLPPSLELYRSKAGAAYEAGQHAEMAAQLRKALPFAPDDSGLRRDLAMALGGAEQYEEAFQIARDLLRKQPDSPELNALAGTALLHQEKPQPAVPYLRKALARDPKNLAVSASLGRAYLLMGEPKLAVPYLEAAAETDKDGSLHWALARALRESGQKERAAAALVVQHKLAEQQTMTQEPALAEPE